MEIKGSNGRERLAFTRFYIRPCVLRAEGGDCWWFGHTVNSVQFSCDICPSVSSVPLIGSIAYFHASYRSTKTPNSMKRSH